MSKACNPVAFLKPVAPSTANLLNNSGIVAANDGTRLAYGI